jgi:DinB superfamily
LEASVLTRICTTDLELHNIVILYKVKNSLSSNLIGSEAVMLEANPYARYLDGRPVDEVLAATPAALASIADAIGAMRISVAPAPGKWTPAEILCHLADCEVAFGFRLRQTLAQDNHTIQPFDQDRWAALYPSITAQQALVAFTAMREWNLILIRNAPPTAAAKPVTHPERGAMTFSTILETMAGHDINHLQQLQKLATSS